MSDRTIRRFVECLLRGQRTEHARPDDFEAEQMKTAIELRAARLGSDAPREEFVTDLHRRLAAEMSERVTSEGLQVHGARPGAADPVNGHGSEPGDFPNV